jgi:tyramine---L-glutamate ligase
MSSSTLLVYEFFTGGGCLGKDIPACLAIEALGMIWAVLADFKRWGKVRTVAAMDARVEDIIPGLNLRTLPADVVIRITENCGSDPFSELIKSCDAALIIAPETDGILSALTKQAENANIQVLGSCSSAAAIAGDKAQCHRVFQNEKLPSPPTWCLPFESALDALKQMRFPLVVKPVDGVGSDGVCCIHCSDDIGAALDMVRSVTSHSRFLLQPFIEGQHVSVSVLAVQGRCMALSVNHQLVKTGSTIQYQGSRVPFRGPSAATVMELACSAVRSVPGLRGYVGVDLVVTEDSVQLIEINPRLTTSYIGLRLVSRTNLAEAIWNACIHGVLPDRIPIFGDAVIMKSDFNTWELAGKS